MKHLDSVRLSGQELEHVRPKVADVMRNLEHIAHTILEKIGHDKLPLGRKGIASIVVRPRNEKIILVDDDGHCIGVYEDPPGVCRPCGADEPGGGFPSNPTE